MVEVGVVVAEYVGGVHLGKPIQQRKVHHDDVAQVHLPELEQVAQDDEFALLAGNIIEEQVQLLLPVAQGEVVPGPAIAHVQIADDEDGMIVGHLGAPP